MDILRIQGLSISFGGIQALQDVDLQVVPEEILALIGPNGSGKTTLFNCISGVYRPDSGEISFEGESLLGLSPDSVAERGIARTFQNLRLFLHMTVLDNLLLGRHIKFKKNPFNAYLRRRAEELRHREVVEGIIEFLDLQAYRQSRISDCPYGVQKRCEIGRALAMEPRLLLLDEPIAGLTAEEKEDEPSMGLAPLLVQEIFRGISRINAQGTAILLVEHDLKIASRLADRMVAFDHGELIAKGTAEEVQRSPAVIQAYLGDE